MHHRVAVSVRNYMSEEGYWEIRPDDDPEHPRRGQGLGAVRTDPGKFTLLPNHLGFQTNLMVAGVDKYFQIVKCFRDEDLRADRQPEFTQLDIELSFATEETVFEMVEGLVKRVWMDVLGVELETPFRRLTYGEAMSRFGSDKPDTRFGMEIADVSSALSGSSFRCSRMMLESGGVTLSSCRIERACPVRRLTIWLFEPKHMVPRAWLPWLSAWR